MKRFAGDQIRTLAESIAAGLSSNYEKASAIYDWMGQNITYDQETYRTVGEETQRPQDAVSIMNQRSTVREGYSHLAAVFYLLSAFLQNMRLDTLWLITISEKLPTTGLRF